MNMGSGVGAGMSGSLFNTLIPSHFSLILSINFLFVTFYLYAMRMLIFVKISSQTE